MWHEQKVNILIVDDNLDNLLALEAILNNPDLNLMKADSGQAALRHLLMQDFAVILLDVQMPVLDGFETARLIRERERSRDVPIIFLSAYNIEDNHIFRGYSIGGVDYLFKPFIPEILKSKVAFFVDLFKKTEEVKRQAEIVRQLERKEHERERAQTLEALYTSEERFRAIFESTAIGMVLLDLNGRLVECNSALQSMFGCTPEELSGVYLTELTHKDDSPVNVGFYAELAKGERNHYQTENRYSRKDGRLVWGRLTVSLIRDSLGNPQFAIGMIEDVTERKQAELEIDSRVREQEVVAELGQRALSGIEVPALMDEIVSTVTETLKVDFCKILELLPEENTFILRVGIGWQPDYLGRPVLRTGLDSQLGYTLLLLSNEPVIIEDLREETRFWAPTLLRKHGVVSGMSVVIGGRKEPFGVLGVYTNNHRVFTKDDINFLQSVANVLALAVERKRAEEVRTQLLTREQEARKEAESANRIKDEFLAVVSHELRTPVTGILGWAELLNEGGLDESTSIFALEAIARNASLQVQLIEDLLDVSRIIMGKLRIDSRQLDLVLIIQAAVGSVLPAAEAKEIELHCSLNMESVSVIGDSDRLQQVICNLLSNAIKFTPEGGYVEVRLEAEEGKARISVIDTGKGISPEFLPYVFERFRQADSTSTREHGGMGLGLAIVRHLVEMHGGCVQADSKGEGYGATFTVELPLAKELSAKNEDHGLRTTEINANSSQSMVLQGLYVLVVDDEADTRDLLYVILQKYGAEVALASSAAEAFEEILRRPPNILISDIGMPEEDGYSLISKIRALAPEMGGNIPAMALTAYARNEDRERALLAGFQLHIPKPIEPSKLVEDVARLAFDHAVTYTKKKENGNASHRVAGKRK
jgi:PAS domain S-box-containing protein